MYPTGPQRKRGGGTLLKTKPAKLYKSCRECGRKNYPAWSSNSLLNAFCSPHCAADNGQRKSLERKAKALRKQHRERKEATRDRGYWLAKAQQAFNAFIRERDHSRECIVHGYDCPSKTEAFHAGHFLSVGSHPELRFVTWNVHKQCASSNMGANKYAKFSRDAHIGERYEAMLRLRIGDDRVDWLKGPHGPKQYRIEDLKRIKSIFNKRARQYRKRREAGLS